MWWMVTPRTLSPGYRVSRYHSKGGQSHTGHSMDKLAHCVNWKNGQTTDRAQQKACLHVCDNATPMYWMNTGGSDTEKQNNDLGSSTWGSHHYQNQCCHPLWNIPSDIYRIELEHTHSRHTHSITTDCKMFCCVGLRQLHTKLEGYAYLQCTSS